MYEKIKKWYKQGFWTEKMVNDAVDKEVITKEEAEQIIKEE